MTVALVTGATGFLGQHLARRLVREGYRVIGVGRNEAIGRQLEQDGIEFVRLAFHEQQKLTALCEGVDYVFHCGALSSHWGTKEAYYEANVAGTEAVIAGCERYLVKRLIHVSTPSLYFCYDSRLNVREEEPLPPTFANDYAATKYRAEQLVDAAFMRGLPVMTLRPRAIFGEGDNALMPNIIAANETRGVPYFNDGDVLIDVTYVGNVVDALLLCVMAPETCLGQKYNITNGEPIKLADLLPRVFAALEVPFRPKRLPYGPIFWLASCSEWLYRHVLTTKQPLLTKYTVSVLGLSQTLSIAKAQRELGYVPAVSVQEGVERYVNWYKQSRRSH